MGNSKVSQKGMPWKAYFQQTPTRNDLIGAAIVFLAFLVLFGMLMLPRCEVELGDIEVRYAAKGAADLGGQFFLRVDNGSVRLDRAFGNAVAGGELVIGKVKYSAPIWHSSCSAIGHLAEGAN